MKKLVMFVLALTFLGLAVADAEARGPIRRALRRRAIVVAPVVLSAPAIVQQIVAPIAVPGLPIQALTLVDGNQVQQLVQPVQFIQGAPQLLVTPPTVVIQRSRLFLVR